MIHYVGRSTTVKPVWRANWGCGHSTGGGSLPPVPRGELAVGAVAAPTVSPNCALSAWPCGSDGPASSLARAARGLPPPPAGISVIMGSGDPSSSLVCISTSSSLHSSSVVKRRPGMAGMELPLDVEALDRNSGVVGSFPMSMPRRSRLLASSALCHWYRRKARRFSKLSMAVALGKEMEMFVHWSSSRPGCLCPLAIASRSHPDRPSLVTDRLLAGNVRDCRWERSTTVSPVRRRHSRSMADGGG